MSTSLRFLSLSRLLSRSFVPVAAMLFLAAGCGGNKPPVNPPDTSAAAATTAPDAASAQATTDPAPASAATPPADTAPPAVGSKKVTKKPVDPAWATCHASYKAKAKEVTADVQKMSTGCASVTKMKQVGTTIKGTQGESNAPGIYKLKAAAGHCYRVYAQAEATIKDLDLLLKDSAGTVAAEDSTDDPSPVLFEDSAFCFNEADDATVIVSVGQGKGAYAVQIWGD